MSDSGRPPEGERLVLVMSAEPRLPRLVRLALEPGRFRVITAHSRAEALDLVARQEPALVVLDVEQRDGDGFAVCEGLRELADIPVIFLAAQADDETKLRALRCGDDYVPAPFSLEELLARVEMILRRARPYLHVKRATYDDGLLMVDAASHQVSFGGLPVYLTSTEWRILTLLVENRNRVLLHEVILVRVWGKAYREDYHTLRLHIANLRKKIEPDPARPHYIKTHRGLGYSFAPQPLRASTN